MWIQFHLPGQLVEYGGHVELLEVACAQADGLDGHTLEGVAVVQDDFELDDSADESEAVHVAQAR